MTYTNYRERIFAIGVDLVRSLGVMESVLDFGGGDGWYGRQLRDSGLARRAVAAEVLVRRKRFLECVLYDGARLPFRDRSFDLTLSFDVLHHTHRPRLALRELLRCAGRYVLVKDHTFRRWPGRLALVLLDELGNRRFGVPSPGRYQREWEWLHWFEEEGFTLERLIHPAVAHHGLLGLATNRLQFVGLWRRRDVKDGP